jgi:hypothetical protein
MLAARCGYFALYSLPSLLSSVHLNETLGATASAAQYRACAEFDIGVVLLLASGAAAIVFVAWPYL